jgi:hypothetical protein
MVELGEADFHTEFLGSYDNAKTITELGFRSYNAYLRAFNTARRWDKDAGSILPNEASDMKRRAALCARSPTRRPTVITTPTLSRLTLLRVQAEGRLADGA